MTYFVVIFLVLLSATFSGLTLGFFSLNRDDLERKSKLGDPNAKKVFKLRKNGNLLLCTLLIGNVSVNSALSIFLGSLTSGVLAGLLATSLIVVFGEIIPQATFSRYALALGAKFSDLVKFFVIIFYPICWPLAKMLDIVLGEEIPTIYSRHELIKLIEDHEDLKESDIDATEERIIKGALSFSSKTVEQVMTPRTTMFALRHDKALNNKTISEISNSGHSRIPVYKESMDDVMGVLYVKDLIKNNWKNKEVKDMCRKDVIFVDRHKKLDDLLNDFKRTRHHLFVVTGEYGGVSGIVTIEDVLEEILGEEIVDEFDKHEDLQVVARKKMEKKKKNTV